MSGFSSHKDSTGIFRSVSSTTRADQDEPDPDQLNRNLLIFIDRGRTQVPFDTYEIRVLKSFLQTASTIYENMTLYHNLLRMLRIKEQEAVTDMQTGVYNYRYFQSQIEREIIRSERHGKIFSVAMIDVDNFKEYNDTHGHLSGDIALRKLAETIHRNIRKSDILARFGGDEFIIILPELNKSQARALAEKLCQVISRTKLPARKLTQKVRLTISLGIASYPEDGNDEDQLVKKADKAMYQAKNTGRNTVCISA
jgi:diguanylate cyclase (GGDEF)-like protein